MAPGGTIVSALHNYQLYDAMLSKLAIIMEVPKEFFVQINFLYEDNKDIKLLEEKYNEAYLKRNLKYSFSQMLEIFDYIFVVNYMGCI